MGFLASLGSVALATLVAATLGLALGRLATQWLSARGVTNLMTELRGGFLPFLAVPALGYHLEWPRWVLLGLVVGAWQAGAVARWIGRRSGEWAPTLLGGIALGRSGAALVTRLSAARGAVVASIATTAIQVVTVEGLLVLMGVAQAGSRSSLGAWLLATTGPYWLLALLGLAALVMGAEWLCSRALQPSSQR